jgi:hypothetical protein
MRVVLAAGSVVLALLAAFAATDVSQVKLLAAAVIALAVALVAP